MCGTRVPRKKKPDRCLLKTMRILDIPELASQVHLTPYGRLSLEIYPLIPFFINFLLHVVRPSGTWGQIRNQTVPLKR